MVAIMEKLLGPSGVRLQSSKINLKAPHYGSPVEWHQDWAFYPHTNDDMLAVGVMLDDAFMENGPLMVVPGSHKGPTWDHHSGGYFCGAMDPTRREVDFESAVPLIGPRRFDELSSCADGAWLGAECLRQAAAAAAV